MKKTGRASTCPEDPFGACVVMSSIDRSTAAESAEAVRQPAPEPEVFGALGPVLVITFLLWIAVVAAVGSSV